MVPQLTSAFQVIGYNFSICHHYYPYSLITEVGRNKSLMPLWFALVHIKMLKGRDVICSSWHFREDIHTYSLTSLTKTNFAK